MISRLWRGGRGIGTVVVAVVVVGAPVVPAKAADGDFDPTFDGGDGKVVSDFGFDDAAQSVAVQGDRIVAVGGRRRRRTRSPSSATCSGTWRRSRSSNSCGPCCRGSAVHLSATGTGPTRR